MRLRYQDTDSNISVGTTDVLMGCFLAQSLIQNSRRNAKTKQLSSFVRRHDLNTQCRVRLIYMYVIFFISSFAFSLQQFTSSHSSGPKFNEYSADIHTYIHTYIHVYIYVYIQRILYICIHNMRMHIYVYVYIYIYIYI